MNSFEKQLCSILDKNASLRNKTYVGRNLYGMVTENIRAKISFSIGDISDHYERPSVTLLTPADGAIDKVDLRFQDLWGTKQLHGKTISPHLWFTRGELDWYGFQPTPTELEQVSGAVSRYLDNFQEQAMEQADVPQYQQEQTM